MKILRHKDLPDNQKLAIVEIANKGWTMGRMPKSILLIRCSFETFNRIKEQKSPRINNNKKITVLSTSLFDLSFYTERCHAEIRRNIYKRFYNHQVEPKQKKPATPFKGKWCRT